MGEQLTNEKISLMLYNIIPENQKRAVFGQERCEIEPEFLGFVKIYKNLSEIIPKHFTVIDFGCAYNPQSYLFTDHKRFIAVDEDPNTIPFKAQGTEFVNTSIDDFLTNRLHEFDLDETFTICSYVPDEEAAKKYSLMLQESICILPFQQKKANFMRICDFVKPWGSNPEEREEEFVIHETEIKNLKHQEYCVNYYGHVQHEEFIISYEKQHKKLYWLRKGSLGMGSVIAKSGILKATKKGTLLTIKPDGYYVLGGLLPSEHDDDFKIMHSTLNYFGKGFSLSWFYYSDMESRRQQELERFYRMGYTKDELRTEMINLLEYVDSKENCIPESVFELIKAWGE